MKNKSSIVPMINNKLYNYLKSYISYSTDRFLSCNIYKNRILAVLVSLVVIFILTIGNVKNERLRNIYFYFDSLFISFLIIYLVVITIGYYKKIKELDKLARENNELFYDSFIANESNRKNQIGNFLENIKIYTDRLNKEISTYNEVKNKSIDYLNRSRTQTKQSIKKEKLFTKFFSRIKDLVDARKARRSGEKNKTSREITVLERILGRISKIITNLVPKGGFEIGSTKIDGGSFYDTPKVKNENITKTNEGNSNNPNTIEQVRVETAKEESKQIYNQTEPTIISNNMPIDRNIIEDEIKNNVLSALEKANREATNINKNEKEAIEQPQLTPEQQDSIIYNLPKEVIWAAEEQLGISIDRDPYIGNPENGILAADILEQQPNTKPIEKPEEEMSLEDMFSIARSSDDTNENASTKNNTIEDGISEIARNELIETTQTTENEFENSNQKDNIKNATNSLHVANLKQQNKDGISIPGI